MNRHLIPWTVTQLHNVSLTNTLFISLVLTTGCQPSCQNKDFRRIKFGNLFISSKHKKKGIKKTTKINHLINLTHKATGMQRGYCVLYLFDSKYFFYCYFILTRDYECFLSTRFVLYSAYSEGISSCISWWMLCVLLSSRNRQAGFAYCMLP